MDDSPRLEIPPWVLDWLQIAEGTEDCRAAWTRQTDGSHLRDLSSNGLRLISLSFPNAVSLPQKSFETLCFEAYGRLQRLLQEKPQTQPIRLWNFIPQILSPLGELEHRYMVFNAGRFRALKRWLEGQVCQVATASGVGHRGDDLVIHCLAAEHAGLPVENPRQVPAYRYSARYGPIPPCFSRATRWSRSTPQLRSTEAPWLLVGGTASVRGEDSLFIDDLERQIDETLHNLATLAEAGLSKPPTELSGLHRFRNFRVYYVHEAHRRAIEARLERDLPARAEVEYRRADLCRPDLLVEIEGLAGGPAVERFGRAELGRPEPPAAGGDGCRR